MKQIPILDGIENVGNMQVHDGTCNFIQARLDLDGQFKEYTRIGIKSDNYLLDDLLKELDAKPEECKIIGGGIIGVARFEHEIAEHHGCYEGYYVSPSITKHLHPDMQQLSSIKTLFPKPVEYIDPDCQEMEPKVWALTLDYLKSLGDPRDGEDLMRAYAYLDGMDMPPLRKDIPEVKGLDAIEFYRPLNFIHVKVTDENKNVKNYIRIANKPFEELLIKFIDESMMLDDILEDDPGSIDLYTDLYYPHVCERYDYVCNGVIGRIKISGSGNDPSKQEYFISPSKDRTHTETPPNAKLNSSNARSISRVIGRPVKFKETYFSLDDIINKKI